MDTWQGQRRLSRGNLVVTLQTISRLTGTLGLLSSLLVLLLLAINVVTGVSQEYFESTHPAPEYTESIVRDAGVLSLTFTMDKPVCYFVCSILH